MAWFIVTDEQKEAHLVESGSEGGAFVMVPGAVSVRIATYSDITKYSEEELKEKGIELIE
jgi:hypothetical protein